MAKKRITELTALTSPATGDFLPIVDVSDLTQAASGSTKKITVANFANNLPASTFANLQTFSSGISLGNETLLSYDTGTFTPTLVGSSVAGSPIYSAQSGDYTRIGRIVHFNVRLVWTSLGGLSGNVTITGLPFANAGAQYRAGGIFAYWNSVSFTANTVPLFRADGTTIALAESSATTAVTSITDTQLTAAGEIYLQGWYTTTSN
jgi:hypothetical protein